MGFDLRNELRPAGPFSGMLGCWAVSIDPFGVQAMFGQNGVATRALQTGAAAQLLRWHGLCQLQMFLFSVQAQSCNQSCDHNLGEERWVLGCLHNNLAFLFFPNVSRKTWTLRRICSLSFRACTLAFSYARQIRETNTAPNIADVAIRVFNRFESRTSQMWRFLPIPCTPRPREICLHFSRELDRHSKEFKENLRTFKDF